MLFSGDEAKKKTNVLSGGERVRCVLSKIMLSQPNLLLLDDANVLHVRSGSPRGHPGWLP
jgi:ATPase subunit of ABC transporter with duplicated ATPase domains